MREICDHFDLAKVQEVGEGFLANIREDVKKLHRAGCEAVSAMGTKEYRKVFFDTAVEAREWLDREYGPRGWSNCGRCGGAG